MFCLNSIIDIYCEGFGLSAHAVLRGHTPEIKSLKSALEQYLKGADVIQVYLEVVVIIRM